MDDCELLKAFVRDGNESAFDAVMRRHGGVVCAAVRRRLGNEDWAREVTQTVFVVLARKAPRLRVRASLGPWLHRVAMMECADLLRREQRQARKKRVYERHLKVIHDGEESREAMCAQVDEVVDSLPERERQIIVWRFFEGRSFREIGEKLGISDDACQKRSSRAVAKVTASFRRRGFAASIVGAGFLSLREEALADGIACPWLTCEALALRSGTGWVTAGAKGIGLMTPWSWLGVASLAVISVSWGWGWHVSKSLVLQLQAVENSGAEEVVSGSTVFPLLTRRSGGAGDTSSVMLERFIDAYLEDDQDFLRELNAEIRDTVPGDVLVLLEAVEEASAEGAAPLAKLLLGHLAETHPAMVCRRAHARRLLDLAAYGLNRWARSAPEEAIAWFLAQHWVLSDEPRFPVMQIGQKGPRPLPTLSQQVALRRSVPLSSVERARLLSYGQAMGASLYHGFARTHVDRLDSVVPLLSGEAAYGAAVAANRLLGNLPKEKLNAHIECLMNLSEVDS